MTGPTKNPSSPLPIFTMGIPKNLELPKGMLTEKGQNSANRPSVLQAYIPTSKETLQALLKSAQEKKCVPAEEFPGSPKRFKEHLNTTTVQGVKVYQPIGEKAVSYFKERNNQYLFVQTLETSGFVVWNQVEKLNHRTQVNGKQTISYPPIPSTKDFGRIYLQAVGMSKAFFE